MDIKKKNFRKYGSSPFKVAVIHGGPGASGEMAPVARTLQSEKGILEPLQTEMSVEGQIEELKVTLEQHGDIPVTLIGYSWGAWLCYLLASEYPAYVKKLILVSSGPFEEYYTATLRETRIKRLNEEERKELESIEKILRDPNAKNRDSAFSRFGKLFSKTETYDPVEDKTDDANDMDLKVELFEKVWNQAANLRKTGKLLEAGKNIKCPIVAIHGDYDPHSEEGVRVPLSRQHDNFRFVLLKKCGHMPWIEKEAKEKFYKILKEEL